jgi:hypothetical protein
MSAAADKTQTKAVAVVAGSDAELEILLAKFDAMGTDAVGKAKMQKIAADIIDLSNLGADEATLAQAEELAKAWIDGDEPMRKAFAGHWVARARGTIGNVERAGERLGRKAGEAYAGTNKGRASLARTGERASFKARNAHEAKLSPRMNEGNGAGYRGFVDEAPASARQSIGARSGPGFRGFVDEAPAPVKRYRGNDSNRSTYQASAAKYNASRQKGIDDAGNMAGRSAMNNAREGMRVKGGQIGRRVAQGAMVGGAAAAAGGAAYGAKRAWDESKRRRDKGRFA